MNRKRVVRVTASTIALAIGVYLLVVFANKDQGTTQETYRRISALEDRARHRFAESRGLTPCGNDERRWLSAAERKLALAGYPSPRVIVVAAPTFSDISLLAIGDAALDRYTFPEQTAFGPEFLDEDRVKPRALLSVEMTQETRQRLIAAISRNTEYAMSSREYGYDGVVYYFGSGADRCAMAWSPTGGTIGGKLRELVDHLLREQPSLPAVEQTLAGLEDMELAH